MTDQNLYMKWFYRCVLLGLTLIMSYVIFQPEYNFAHWVPHRLLRAIGVPYSALLYFESNADMLLHPFGAMVLTALLIKSQLPLLSLPKVRVFAFMCAIMLLAEIIQFKIGRGFEISDILLGVIGSYTGYRLCLVNRQQKIKIDKTLN